MPHALAAAVAGGLALSLVVSAHAADPAVPPGQDPGGHAVALIGGGIDYRSAKISPRLARDGEGEIIGWDFVEEDRHPFEAVGETAVAEALVSAYARGRLVAVRLAGGDARALARAIGFATGTPARIVAITQPIATADLREVMRQAAERFRDVLFVIHTGPFAPTPAAAPVSAAPAAPSAPSAPAPAAAPAAGAPPEAGPAGGLGALMNQGNVLLVAAGAEVDGERAASVARAAELVVISRGASMFGAPPDAPPRNGAEAVALAAAAAACQGHGRDALLGSAAKAATLAAARPLEQTPSIRALDPLCFYGGTRF